MTIRGQIGEASILYKRAQKHNLKNLIGFSLCLSVILVLTILCPSASRAQVSFDASAGGSIRPGYDNQACTSVIEGAIRYNSSSTCAEFCDGSDWTCPSGGAGGCLVTWDALTDEFNTAQSATIESDIQLVTTASCSPDVSISGTGSPEFRICSDSTCSSVAHAYGTSTVSIENGEFLQARLTSSASPGGINSALITIGSTATSWDVETANVPEYISNSITTANWPASEITSVNRPAGTVENDLMITTMVIDQNAINIQGPAGWTELRDVNTDNQRMAIYYKVAGGSEPAAYDFDFNDDEYRIATIITIRNVDTANPISTNSTNTGNSDQPVAASITTTTDNNLLVAITHYVYGGSHTPPASYDERVDRTNGSFLSHSVATILQPASGVSGTASFQHSDNGDHWRTEHIAVQPP